MSIHRTTQASGNDEGDFVAFISSLNTSLDYVIANMTNIYKILFNRRAIGLCYVSPHPELEGQKIASIVPLTRKGEFEDNTLEIHFENPVSDIFPDSLPDIEMLGGLVRPS